MCSLSLALKDSHLSILSFSRSRSGSKFQGDSLEARLSRGDFYTEYEELPTKSHVSQLHHYDITIMTSSIQNSDINAGQLPENIPKNRYKDILPYEVDLQVCKQFCCCLLFVCLFFGC